MQALHTETRFREEFGAFPHEVTRLFNSVDPRTILEHGVFHRQPGKAWGEGRLTMVGDAAHVLPPNLGQGTSMALEDAYQLGAAVRRHGLSEAAFRDYEVRGRARCVT